MSNTSRKLSTDEVSALMEGLQTGAIGVAIYNQGSELFRGNLVSNVGIPVLGISKDDVETCNLFW